MARRKTPGEIAMEPAFPVPAGAISEGQLRPSQSMCPGMTKQELFMLVCICFGSTQSFDPDCVVENASRMADAYFKALAEQSPAATGSW